MAKMTIEETKESLKKEIVRLGIQDNPSRTVYQKEYQRGVAPSPNNAMKVTGMKWQDLMNELGFKYASYANVKFNARDNAKGVEKKIRLTNPDTRQQIIDKALEWMHKDEIQNVEEFKKNSKHMIGVNYGTLSKYGYSFERLKELYKDKYGEEIKSEHKGRWNHVDKKELINLLIEAMVNNNLNNLSQYSKWCKENNDYPSIATLQRRLDMTYKELNKLVKVLK
ncbi:hypothetical protein [Limosilactobacillus mucosae]|nr:hypothetical protein [Limosilactobacillus mucosae]